MVGGEDAGVSTGENKKKLESCDMLLAFFACS